MSRYSFESLKIFSGVSRKISIESENTSPIVVRTTDSPKSDISEVNTEVFSLPYSLAPKSWDIITAQPAFAPVPMAMKIIVIGYDAPTAARASLFMKLPAITLSQTL